MRIGNGLSTTIWSDQWIPNDGNFKIITPQPESYYPWRVADLINPMTGWWNKDFIDNTFWEVDRGRILAVPLGSNAIHDRMIWHYSKDGRFSVRSCYQFIFRTSSPWEATGSGSGIANFRWNDIWKLPIPSKIRMFIWRACAGILPHKVGLFRRHIVSKPMCESCSKEVESLHHVFMVCRGMRDIWRSHPVNISTLGPQVSMLSIFLEMRRLLSPELFLVSLVVCWKAWEIRNGEVHRDGRGFPPDLVSWATNFLECYRSAQLNNPSSKTPELPEQWHPPEGDAIKLNVDVAIPDSSTSFGISLVARDSSGSCIWWGRKVLYGRPQPSDGEAMAVFLGVQVALDRAWRRVIIETDCYPIFYYLTHSSSSSLASYGATLDSCLALRPSFISLSFSFVRRSGNSLAHSIATATDLHCSDGLFSPPI